MFGPLSFPSKNEKCDLSLTNEQLKSTVCMLCEEEFVLPRQETLFFQHLFLNHRIFISDANKIAYLDKYVEYWKVRLRNVKLEDLGIDNFVETNKMRDCDLSVIGNDDAINDILSKGGNIFFLSCNLLEDKILRDNLQTKKLEFVLEQQRLERENNNYCRECLFCHTEIIGTTADYLNHLSGKHNLFIGKPQNLVFVDQLISHIESKLNNLQCLYCEKVFKDRNVLKEHMRKKLHKRINPKNTAYDRFYIVNYLQIGRKFKHLEKVKQNESPDSDDSDSDWSDWREEMQLQIVCLFCKNNFLTWDDTLDHMTEEHNFDYKASTSDMDFYQQVKLVNYIRRQIHRLSCIVCDFVDTSNDSVEILLQHMKNESHFTLPDKSLWDQPEYFFPTYENDLFLCQIDDPTKSETNSLSDLHDGELK